MSKVLREMEIKECNCNRQCRKDCSCDCHKEEKEINFEDLSPDEKEEFLMAVEDAKNLQDELEEEPMDNMMNMLEVQAEALRMEQLVEDYKVNKEVAKSSYYKEGMEMAQTLVAMVKEMGNNGISYSDSVQMAFAFYQIQESKKVQQNVSKSDIPVM
jgi:hypothetical protein